MAWIQKLETAQGQPHYKVIWRDTAGREITKTFPNKDIATAWKKKVEADILMGTYFNPAVSKVKFRSVAEQWLEDIDVKPKTLADYRYAYTRWIDPALGSTAIGAISRQDCRDFLEALEVSQSTRHAIYRVLRTIFSFAVDRELLQRHPCLKLNISKGERREVRPLTPEEIAAIASRVPDRYRSLVYVLAFGGLRFGEAAALRVKDIQGQRLVIRENAVEVNGTITFGTPKAGKVAPVILPASVAGMLEDHVKRYCTVDANGVQQLHPDPEALVFAGEKGGVLRHTVFHQRVWRPACRLAELEPIPRIHDLRHTAVSLRILAGAHPKEIQEAARHSSISMTMDVYAHLMPTTQEESAARLDKFVL